MTNAQNTITVIALLTINGFSSNILTCLKSCISHPTWLKNIKLASCCLNPVFLIPSFRCRDNSVHLQQCSPFWVGILITFNKENYYCLLFYVNMHNLIDKALKQFYMLQESLILCKHGNILLSLTLKKKFKLVYYIHIHNCRNTYQQGSKLLQT